MRPCLINLCLLLVSCAIGLSLCEVSLRLFYPRYRDLAEAQFVEKDALRIWASKPNSRNSHVHPDTRLSHTLLHNNFGLRQHREFEKTDLAVATNVGFFGDSFTANIRMAAPYSFTEPLDYLLNLRRERFNVLNFGADGYGTGQSFLHYEHFLFAEDLDHVLYVHHNTDLRELHVNGLFHLDDESRLVQVEPVGRFRGLVSKFHVTYLVLDAIGRTPFMVETLKHFNRVTGDTRPIVRGFAGQELARDDLQISLDIFRQLIRRWKNLVEDNGGNFYIVFLPARPPQSFPVYDLIQAEGIEEIDLYTCFNDVDPAHSQTSRRESPYTFKNDRHWNEAGNSLAAICLYRALEVKMGSPVLSENELQEAVSRYYAAFGGGEFLPSDIITGGTPRGRLSAAEIRKKYMELDLKSGNLR